MESNEEIDIKDRIQIIGYGTLLSEKFARDTVPSLSNFQLGIVFDYVRIFNKVSLQLITMGSVEQNEPRVASLAARNVPGATMVACTFTCPGGQFGALFEREHLYRWENADFQAPGGKRLQGKMCCEWSDKEYRLQRCECSMEYARRTGDNYAGRIWRQDILPEQNYLNRCLDACREHGDDVYRNFLTTTYLADGVTTLGSYLNQEGDEL